MWSDTECYESQTISTDMPSTPECLSSEAGKNVTRENASGDGKMEGGAREASGASLHHALSSCKSDARNAGGESHCAELDFDSLSLTDILMEFDVHYGEAMSNASVKPTVTSVCPSTSLTQSECHLPRETSPVPTAAADSKKQASVSLLVEQNWRETSNDPFSTPSQLRKFVKFSDNHDVRTYGQPSGVSAAVYTSAGSRPGVSAVSTYDYQYPFTSSKTNHVTGNDSVDTYIKTGVKAQFCDRGVALELTNDKNDDVYDDVEVLPRHDDVTRRATDATLSRDKNDNDDVEKDDKPNVIAIASDFAVQRTVALMMSWILTGVLTGIICSRLYTWRLHYDVTYEEISRTFVVEGVGTVVGAMFFWAASTVSSSFHGDAMIGLAMVMLAAYPCYYNFLYFIASSLVFGFAKGLLFVGSIYIVKRQWDATKSALCIHLLYVSLATGWFISIHLGRPFAEQILLIPVSPPGRCEIDGHDVTSLINITDEVVLDAAISPENFTIALDEKSLGAGAAVCDDIKFPIVFIPLAFISVCLGLFFVGLSCCSCCKELDASIARRRRRTRKKRAMRQINLMKNIASKNDYVKVDELLHGNRTGEQTGSDDGENLDDERMILSSSIRSEAEQADDGVRPGVTKRSGKKRDSKKHTNQPKTPTVSLSPKKNKEIKRGVRELSKWFQAERSFDVAMLMFFYVFHFIPSGIELGVGRFMSVYAGRNRLLLSTTAELTLAEDVRADVFDWSVILVSTYWGSVIFGRLLSVCVSHRAVSSICFSISCPILQFLSAVILSIYGHRFPSLLWTFVALSGCALAPVSPGAWTWADIFLTAETKSIASGVAMSAIGGSLATWLTGLGVDYYGSTSVWLMAAVASLLAGVLAVPVIAQLETQRVRYVEELRRREPRSTYV